MLFRSSVLSNKQFKQLGEKNIDLLQYILQYEKFPEYKNLTYNLVGIFCWDDKIELNPTNAIKTILKKLNKYSYDGILELIKDDKKQAEIKIKVNNDGLYKTHDLMQKVENINTSFLCLCYDMKLSFDQASQLIKVIFEKLSINCVNTIFDIAKTLCKKEGDKYAFINKNNYNYLLKIAACFEEFKLTNCFDTSQSINSFFVEYNGIHNKEGKKKLYSEERLNQIVIDYKLKVDDAEIEESIFKIYPITAIDCFINFINGFLLNHDEIASDYSFFGYLPEYKQEIAKNKLLPFINKQYKEISGCDQNIFFINDLEKTKSGFLKFPIYFLTSISQLNNLCLFESYIEKNKFFILNCLKELMHIMTLNFQLIRAVYNNKIFPELNRHDNKIYIDSSCGSFINSARSIFLIYCYISESTPELDDPMLVFTKELLFHIEVSNRKTDLTRLLMFKSDLNEVVIDKNILGRRSFAKEYGRILKIWSPPFKSSI